MLKIKSFENPKDRELSENRINSFISAVDVLENGIKFTTSGDIFILYKEKDTDEEIAKKKAKEEEEINKLPQLAEDFNLQNMLKLYSQTLSALTEAQLKLKTCSYVEKMPLPKGQETQHKNQRAINTMQAQREVDQKKVELEAITQVINEIKSDTFKL